MDRGASAAMLVIKILKDVLVSNNGEVCYPWGRFDAMVRYTASAGGPLSCAGRVDHRGHLP
jgi:hypothetical protein